MSCGDDQHKLYHGEGAVIFVILGLTVIETVICWQACMDREKQDEVAKLQLSWIDGICLPLYKVCVCGGGVRVCVCVCLCVCVVCVCVCVCV